MKSTEKLLSKVDRALGKLGAVPGSGVLVGFSGGPDSTALLVALGDLSQRRGLRVTAAHIDHGIRGPAEREAEMASARAVCRLIGVPLVATVVEPGLIEREARSSHRSLEETARAHRMAALVQAARLHRCSLVALGHTADDQIETMIMRFFQGSGARGLAGIRARAGGVIRPLLECSRDEVMRFLKARGLSCHTDSTNTDRRFLRNRVRADLMPVLASVFRGHRAALRSLSRKMSDLADFLDAELERRDVWIQEDAGGFCADVSAFRALPRALRAESLYRVIDRVSPLRKRLSYRSVESLADAAPSRPDSEFRLAGARVTQHKGRYVAGPDIVHPEKRGYFRLVEPVVSQAGSYCLSLEAQVGVSGGCRRTVEIGGTGIRPPVIVRSRRGGDLLRTAGGGSSLKEMLSQWGVPSDARDDAAVVVDSVGVAAVIALPWGARAADRPDSGGRGSLSLTSIQENGAECAKQ